MARSKKRHERLNKLRKNEKSISAGWKVKELNVFSDLEEGYASIRSKIANGTMSESDVVLVYDTRSGKLIDMVTRLTSEDVTEIFNIKDE